MFSQGHADALVVGAGACGLFVALKLAQSGMKTVLVDRADRIATGVSGRNEGWLHCGTYHASSIGDTAEAIRVAQQCKAGHFQIRSIAPEAVASQAPSTVALTMSSSRSELAESRWREAGVAFDRLSPGDLRAAFPMADLSQVDRAYLVADLGVDNRMLYDIVLRRCLDLGVAVHFGQTLRFSSPDDLVLVGEDGTKTAVDASYVIVCTGPWTAETFSAIGVEIPMRQWKSHLLRGPIIGDRPVFWLDPLAITIMNHADGSVVGMNEDAYLVDGVDFEVDEARAAFLSESLRAFMPSLDVTAFTPSACLKTDLGISGQARSVDAKIFRPPTVRDGVMCVLPGKMTEAPYVADLVVGVVTESA